MLWFFDTFLNAFIGKIELMAIIYQKPRKLDAAFFQLILITSLSPIHANLIIWSFLREVHLSRDIGFTRYLVAFWQRRVPHPENRNDLDDNIFILTDDTKHCIGLVDC